MLFTFSTILVGVSIGFTSCTPAQVDPVVRDGTFTTVATLGGAAAGAAIDKNNQGRGTMIGAAAGHTAAEAYRKSYTENKDQKEEDTATKRQKAEPNFSIPKLPSSSPFPGIFQ